MKELKTRFVLLFCLVFTLNLNAQSDTVIYDNEIYVDYIKGVSFHLLGVPTSYPILTLGSGRLILSFDDMGGSFYDYTYRLVHCDKDWKPTDISEIEYLDGFNGERIENFTSSENTYVDYTHYTLTFPNEDIRIKASGNYLLIVNDEDELPVITKRFIVNDPKVAVKAESRKSPDVELINSHQSIYFHIEDKANFLSSPRDEVYVSIIQNGRWDSGRKNLRPDNVIGNKIFFNLRRPYIFPGYKEFRNFDIRNLEAATRNVHSIDLNKEGTKAILEVSKNRHYGNYVQENDANGSFVLDNQNDRRWMSLDKDGNGRVDLYELPNDNNYRGAITGDYVEVYSTLKTMEIEDKEVFMVGAFSDWKARNEFKLEYDHERKIYLGNCLLKQGYYDYYFATANNNGEIDTEILEGNHFSTENDYLIIVYQRSFGKNYDEIIGVMQVNSLDNL